MRYTIKVPMEENEIRWIKPQDLFKLYLTRIPAENEMENDLRAFSCIREKCK